MNLDHVHQETRCVHGARLGGCKCLVSPGEHVAVVHRDSCPLAEDCPLAPGRYRAEREGNWTDVYMGEPDVP